MQTHELTQGTPEWLAYRAQHFNASDAPSMMSCSPYKKRSELLHEMHTGISADVDAGTQARFDEGHRIEAMARPLAEDIVGEELYPVTGSNGRYSASFDGLTMAEDVGFEHKTLNSDLRAVMFPGCDGSVLPMVYRVQMEQQMLVSGAERILFMASKWDGDTLVEERHCWYEGDAALREHIILGWEQFDKDLCAYEPAAVVEKAVANITTALPATFTMRVEGKLVSCNLDTYKPAALSYIAAINETLTTDQHFADAKADAEYCRESADKLEAAIEMALGEMGDINAALNTVREIAAAFDAKGLALEKLVVKRNAEIKETAILKVKKEYGDHVAALEKELAPLRLAALSAPNFADAAKNKRTVASLQDALTSALAAGKIAADAMARDYRAKQAWISTAADGHMGLFADLQALCLKPMEDFQLLVNSRITDQNAKDKARGDAVAAAAAKKALDDAAAAAAVAVAATGQPSIVDAWLPGTTPSADPAPRQATFSTVRQLVTPVARAAAPATPPTLKLGQIGERLGFALTGDFLKTLGFEPAARDKSALLFHEASFTHICAALVAHIESIQAAQAA